MINLKKMNRYTLAYIHDVAMAMIAYSLALTLRLSGDFDQLPLILVIASTFLFTATAGIVFAITGLYRTVWAFTSMTDLLKIVKSVTLTVVSFLIIAFTMTRLEGVPRTVPFITWFILLAALGGSRVILRLLRERRLSQLFQKSGHGRVNVLLVGAGDEADLFLRAISSNPHAAFHVVGILGENAKRVGRSIHGVHVLGTVSELPKVIETLKARHQAPSRLVLTRAMTRLNGGLVAELLELSTQLGLTIARLPTITEVEASGNKSGSVSDQPIVLEDLLGRPEIKLNRDAICDLIKDKRVLVTGSGGTIGSELARQISALSPSKLILLEGCEYNLYRIDLELREQFPHLSIKAILGDVRDHTHMEQVFQHEAPNLVFHAAAIKHVPIAEDNQRETVRTNVLGTRIIADCAERAKVMAMVLISTDKAVHPSSVMGASKRLAEMYCQALDLSSETTRFITVRFGNVLGSTGSVVPRFREQLAKGGPITVTHPDITRYFMTAREAVELVLQASALGAKPGDQRGKVLVLDMGQPIKIADLARQMIRLTGLRPEIDVKIVYTGLRPGEKLHEELFSETEELLPSDADGVKLAKSTTIDLTILKRSLSEIDNHLATDGLDEQAKDALHQLVLEYRRAPIAEDTPTIRRTGS